MVQYLRTIRAWTAISGTTLLVLFGLVVYREWAPEWKLAQAQFRDQRIREAAARVKEEQARLASPAVTDSLARLEQTKHDLEIEFLGTGKQKQIQELLQARSALDRQIEEVLSWIRQKRFEYQQAESAGQRDGDPKAVLVQLEIKDKEVEQLTLEKEALEEQKRGIDARINQIDEPQIQVVRAIEAIRAPLKAAERSLAQARALRTEIKQYLLPDGGVDRCATCHPDASRHPIRYVQEHPVERFGCSKCHGGQSRATSRVAAHGRIRHWPTPLLANFELGSACRRCHADGPVAEPFVKRGEKLFAEAGCNGCHEVSGFNFPKIGPSLRKLAEKVQLGWFAYWLRDPKAYLPRTRMPNFSLGESDISAIGAFLLKNTKAETLPVVNGDPQRGEILFKQFRCITCHGLEGRGGTLGPDLGRIGTKVRPQWLVQFLRNPSEYDRNTRMPRYRLSLAQASDLAAYLMEFVDLQPLPQFSRDDVNPETGRRLIARFGCYGCHEIPDFENFPKVGTELDNFGVKAVDRLDFGLVRNIPRTWGSWTYRKVNSPRGFRPGLRMPDYGFTDEEAAYLTVFLKSIAEMPDSELKPRQVPKPTYVPEGEFGRLVADLKCLVCHSIRGTGGTLAPDLSFEGSRVKETWLRKFLADPDTIRLYMEERMPKFNLTPAEIEIIVNYMKTTLLLPDLQEPESAAGPDLSAEGQKLYFEKFKCQSCHQWGLSGGTIGPELTRVGERLEPAWLSAWLKNAMALAKDVPEPQYAATDEERRSLANFLMGAAKP